MSVNYAKQASNQYSDPAINAFSITPSDSVDLLAGTRAIYIGGSGDVQVTMLGGTTVTFPGVLAGTVLPLRVTRVWVTNTTATNMVGLY